MSLLRSLSASLDNPFLYRLWQWPFARAKLDCLKRFNELEGAQNVLDLGCGPGVNACCFPTPGYLGIDINPRYVSYARRRFGRNFVVGDACEDVPVDHCKFDFILANSLLHHLDDARCAQLLGNAASLLASGGYVHILDLVRPDRPGIAGWLARHDRGEYARSLDDWRALFHEFFQPVLFEPFSVRAGGLELLQMIYFKGRKAFQANYTKPGHFGSHRAAN